MKTNRQVFLIVDDDDNDRVLLAHTLKKLSPEAHVRMVADGVEAIDYLNGVGKGSERGENPFPTLMFIDLKMPRLDGFAVLEHISKNPQWAIIPRLVYSASSDPDDIKKAFLTGASAYHVKPNDTQERTKLCRLLLDYWGSSEIPETDEAGNQLRTNSQGKLGERIAQP